MAARAGKVAGVIVVAVLRVVWVSLMALTPLLAFWLASSLAAYNNASQWLSLLIGLLLFPIVPVGWELVYSWRRRTREVTTPAILTRLDRLVLRTLILNGLFLAGMMWQARAASFRALAVRGDWMLDGHNGPVAETLRGWFLAFADRLDRHTPVIDHSYGESDDAPDDVKPNEPEHVPDSKDAPAPTQDGAWPMATAFHPLVVSMPMAEQTSVDAVGRYLAARITNRRELTKALHDYVVNRLSYDHDALKKIEARDYKNVPSQEAEPVFAAKTGVCEGYSRLMTALGKAAGLEIAYVTGAIRDSERRLAISDDPWDTSQREALEGVGHAWNAVKLDDGWHLIDATWNDPTGGDHRTTYLFVPPRLMAFDHYPEDSKWQLLEEPLSLGDFVRQPLLSPTIGELGLTLVSPTRSQITVDGPLEIVLDNPANAAVSARAVRDGSPASAEGEPCNVKLGTTTTITCDLAEGEYEVRMFAAPHGETLAGSYSLDYIGSILVNR
jgi:transglutaminase-like putative cysteine protease